MKIIAHRGYSEKYPENTSIAFEKALECNVDAIECDVQEADGKFYIFHDFFLDRMCSTKQRLSGLSTAQIEEIRVKDKYPIFNLEDLMSLVKKQAVLNLELKFIKHPEQFVRCLLNSAQSFDVDLVISSFNHPLLRELKSLLRDTRLAHKVRFAAVIAHLPEDLADYAYKLDMDIAAIDCHLVTPSFVESAHQYCLEVWAYTVKHEETLYDMQKMKVDGIFCDDPLWARQVLDKNLV